MKATDKLIQGGRRRYMAAEGKQRIKAECIVLLKRTVNMKLTNLNKYLHRKITF